MIFRRPFIPQTSIESRRGSMLQRWWKSTALVLLAAPLAGAQPPSCFFPSPETIACNQTREGRLSFNDCQDGDYRFDLWRVSLPAGAAVRIALLMESFIDEPFLAVFDPAGSLRGEAGPEPSNSRLAAISGFATPGGTWTIYASEMDEFISSADYALRVECGSAPPPPPPPPPGTCVEDATTACLLNGRFRATVRYRNSFDNEPANAVALRKDTTGFAGPTLETEFFYLFASTNIEFIVKMMDIGNTNAAGQPTVAVLTGTATPLRIEVTITDMLTGARRTYVSPFGSQQGVTDFAAFTK